MIPTKDHVEGWGKAFPTEGIASAKTLGSERAHEFAEQPKGQRAWSSVSNGEKLGQKIVGRHPGHSKAETAGFTGVSLL